MKAYLKRARDVVKINKDLKETYIALRRTYEYLYRLGGRQRIEFADLWESKSKCLHLESEIEKIESQQQTKYARERKERKTNELIAIAQDYIANYKTLHNVEASAVAVFFQGALAPIEKKYLQEVTNQLRKKGYLEDMWEWSLSSHTQSEVRQKILVNLLNPYIWEDNSKKANNNRVCFNYICGKSEIDEEFIKELSFLSSDFFEPEYYNRKYIDAWWDMMYEYETNGTRPNIADMIMNGLELSFIRKIYHTKEVGLRDKLSYPEILRNPSADISDEFREKISHLVSGGKEKALLVPNLTFEDEE